MTGSGLTIGLALSPTWLRGAAWRRADSRVEDMFSLAHYAQIAQLAEASGLDFLFLPDPPALHPAVLSTQPGFSTLDSHTLASALAALTNGVGLVPTVHTLFDSPYAAARRLQTLRRLAGPRVGWNAVTALGGAENFGGSPPPVARYERAAEFVTVTQALLASYPDAALRFDRARGQFANTQAIQPIDHAGAHFRVAGPLATPAPPGPAAPVFQAGGSAAGLRFAGAAADAVFVAATTLAQAAHIREQLRDAAVQAGRPAAQIRALPGLSLTLAPSTAEANRLRDTNPGAAHWSIVGTPEQAVEQILSWAEAAAIDGFIALPCGHRASIQLFLERVLPALPQRRIFPEYPPFTHRA